MTPEELTVPSTKRVMHDESCVSGESRTVGCESKGRARGGSVVLRRRRRADVVVIHKHPRVDERRATERAIRRKINQISNSRRTCCVDVASRKCATPRIGAKGERYASIDRRRASRSRSGYRQRGGRSRWVTFSSFFEEYAVRDDDAVTDGWIWMGVDGLLRRPGRRGDDRR